MAYEVACKACGKNLGRVAGTQDRGARLKDFRCHCGGELRRIGWQEMYRNSGRAPKTASQIAAEHLRASGNPAVGYGDAGLLHQIAELIGLPHEGQKTEKKVLDRIERSHHGVLEKRSASYPGRGLGKVRQYWLPDMAPQL